MKIIKLNAIDSTNSYLINLGKNEVLEDGTIVTAKTQTKGRGQLGNYWQSTLQQSLTFSMFKRFDEFSVSQVSSIAFAVSLGVRKGLKKLLISNVKVKWPNDIMSHSKKLSGILIENQIKQNQIVSSVIGIGINVNEANFEDLPQATSMLQVTGVKYDLNEVLHVISETVLFELNKIRTANSIKLKEEYEAALFRKNKVSVFETPNGKRFNGKIKGVTKSGELIVENENDLLKNFQLKEIKMLF